MSGNDDFLSRWSRRKRTVQADAAEAMTEEAAAPMAEPHAEPEQTDAEILEELGLKHPDDLDDGDDFSAYLQKKVPEHLKRVALRKLWRSNPVLACLDGLNDYDEDFTNAVTDAPGVATAYQVGKGMIRRIVSADVPPEAPETVAAPDAPVEIATAGSQTEEAPTMAAARPGDDAQEEGRPAPRHMRFSFDS